VKALQLAFEGFEPAARISKREAKDEHRLFFALKPDAAGGAAAASIFDGLRASHDLQAKFLGAEFLHVTLSHVIDSPEFPQATLDAAIKVAATIQMPPFDIVLDRAMSFRKHKGKQPLVLCAAPGDAGIALLERRISAALVTAGVGGRMVKAGFTPHMTIGYDDARVPEFPLIQKIRWTAREFVLVHSLLGRNRHEELGKWQLQA
jgi:RNA 2',3'-cyclic 3'-phosphodiesterase